VDLSTRLASQGTRGGGELGSQQSQSAFSGMLSDMGIANPVTRDLAGSEYHVQLARQIADFLPARMQKEGGMMLLADVYCLVNRARGTQLISPLDCLTACSLFAQLETPLRLKEFDSGVKAVVADAGTEESIAQRIKAMLQDEERAALADWRKSSGAAAEDSSASAEASLSSAVSTWTPGQPYISVSSLRLSNLWRISVVLARQYLCVAESLHVLCRDEAAHGLSFALNHLDDWA